MTLRTVEEQDMLQVRLYILAPGRITKQLSNIIIRNNLESCFIDKTGMLGLLLHAGKNLEQ